tara:strand:+ start:112 stop:486 length:375 start_codon:yes stop_codon:yes gene_type:complete
MPNTTSTFEPFTYDIDFLKENNIIGEDDEITENAVDLLTSISYYQHLEQIKYGFIDTCGADCRIDSELLNNKYIKLLNEATHQKSQLIDEYYEKYPHAYHFGKHWRKNNYDSGMIYLHSFFLGK